MRITHKTHLATEVQTTNELVAELREILDEEDALRLRLRLVLSILVVRMTEEVR